MFCVFLSFASPDDMTIELTVKIETMKNLDVLDIIEKTFFIFWLKIYNQQDFIFANLAGFYILDRQLFYPYS